MEPNLIMYYIPCCYLDLSAERDVEDCPLPVAAVVAVVAVVIVVVVCAPVLSGHVNGVDIVN